MVSQSPSKISPTPLVLPYCLTANIVNPRFAHRITTIRMIWTTSALLLREIHIRKLFFSSLSICGNHKASSSLSGNRLALNCSLGVSIESVTRFVRDSSWLDLGPSLSDSSMASQVSSCLVTVSIQYHIE